MRALTAEQARAVREPLGELSLAAAAGSGKTTVLVERFVAAVAEGGADPARVLAITFTERAAGELRTRVRARLGELGLARAAEATEGAAVGTISAFCARILRSHPLAAGLDPHFSVLDELTATRLRREAFAQALTTFMAGGGRPALDLVAAYTADGLTESIFAVYAGLRSRGQRRPALPPATPRASVEAAVDAVLRAAEGALVELGAQARAGPLSGAARRHVEEGMELLQAVRGRREDPAALSALALGRSVPALRGEACTAYRDALGALERARADERATALLPLFDRLLAIFGERYEALARARGAVDFDELELAARDLLRSRPALREAWASRYEAIMVDEFQDTNPRQLETLSLLDRGNLFTVGDEQQSIYGFRHADVSIIRARRRALDARGAHAVLSSSFRSRPPILEAVNSVFAPRLGDAHVPLVAGRAERDGPPVELLLTDRDGWSEDGEVGAGLPPTPAWRQAEARLLADRVRALVDAGEVAPGQVAVLVRAVGDLATYERALEACGLPTMAAGGRGYWSAQQVLDLLAHLRVLANPLDEQALLGVLASPLVGLHSDALARLAECGRERGASLWALLLESPPEVPDHAARWAQWMDAERRTAPLHGLEELILRAVKRSGYDARVLAMPGGERRLANVHKLGRLARRFEADEGRDLRGFLDTALLALSGAVREPEAPVEDPEGRAVALMTIHAAKGLEFDVVCVADLGRALPSHREDLLADEARIGLRVRGLDGEQPAPAFDYDVLAGARAAAEREEEERVMYVAMTRARERLLLSGAASFERWPADSTAIAWLAPALVPNLPEVLLGAPAEGPVRVTLSSAASPAFRMPSTDGEPAADPRADEEQPPGGSPPVSGSGRVRGPSVVSYTALAAHAACGYRFYLERVLGLPEADPPGGRRTGDARARGVLAHLALERLSPDRPRAPTGTELASLAREQGLAVSAGDSAGIAASIEALLESPLAARLATMARVRREHPFTFALGPDEPLVVGVVDLIAHDLRGGCLVVDYKTDRLAEGVDPAAAAASHYGVQQQVYALAALRGGAAEVEVAHWYLERPEEPVLVRFAAAEAPVLERSLRGRLGRLAAGGFAVTERPHRGLCATCPGRGGLCSWAEETVMRPISTAGSAAG